MSDKDPKINEEMAVKEFERFAEMMAIDIDKKHMTEDDVSSFEEYKEVLVKAIMKGSLVINDNGEAVFTPVRSDNQDPITFYEPTGATIAAMDRKGKNQDIGKLYETMGSMTQTFAAKFSKMKLADLKICQAIAVFFLA